MDKNDGRLRDFVADLPSTSALVVLAVALARTIEWLAKSIMVSSRRPKDSNGKHYPTSGEQSVDFWKLTIGNVVKDAVKDTIATRDETIRKIIREELDNKIRD